MRGPERKTKVWRANPAEGNDKEEGDEGGEGEEEEEEGCSGGPSESHPELGRTGGGGGDGGGGEEEDKDEMYEMMEYP